MKTKTPVTMAALALATALGLSFTLGPIAAEELPSPAPTAAPEATPEAAPPVTGDPSPGRKLVTTYCVSCHANKENQAEQHKSLAPPLWAIRTRYLRQHPERAEFVAAMVAFILKPDAAKSHMPGAIQQFGIMPPQPFPRELLEDAATAIFEADGISAPGWWADHKPSGPGPGR